jgi:hypothetical protein
MDKPEMVNLQTPEKARTYHYPGHSRTITNVVAVCVRPSGSHRLETADGKKWIVNPGWEAIEIDTPEWTF